MFLPTVKRISTKPDEFEEFLGSVFHFAVDPMNGLLYTARKGFKLTRRTLDANCNVNPSRVDLKGNIITTIVV